MKQVFVVICIFLAACSTDVTSAVIIHTQQPSTEVIYSPTLTPTQSTQSPTSTFSSPATILLSPTPLNPASWKIFPVLPTVDPSLKKIYERGISLGNDPHSFSIFGDCQTQPADFFGVFETEPASLQNLTPELRETIEYFNGSFNHESSTTQDGTTPGALLWTQWHRGEYGCTFAETPVECELRTHRPSFVIIQVGTHFESRNTEYLRRIILQLLDEGVVPILATKADNREKDERINRDMAMLASEYDLPLWNFWAAVSSLTNRGLYTRSDRPLQGDIYLTDEAAHIHRMTGLEALNTVWRAVTEQ